MVALVDCKQLTGQTLYEATLVSQGEASKPTTESLLLLLNSVRDGKTIKSVY